MSNKFAHCHPDGNLMWCQHHNGKWIAFPITKDKDEEVVKEETATTSEKQ